jgi:hypothetical protein
MITLKSNQQNTITYQKETDTPLVTSSYEDGKVFNIVIYPTLSNDTGSASITFTTSSSEYNPRWEVLNFDISSSSEYFEKTIGAKNGTTYNLEVYYGAPFTASTALVWGTTSSTFGSTSEIWSFGAQLQPEYNDVTSGELKYRDRIFISGSVSPIGKKYISSNERAVYTVYQG